MQPVELLRQLDLRNWRKDPIEVFARWVLRLE